MFGYICHVVCLFCAIIFDILMRFTMSRFWCLYGLCPLKSKPWSFIDPSVVGPGDVASQHALAASNSRMAAAMICIISKHLHTYGFTMEIPIKMDDLGVTIIFGNIHIERNQTNTNDNVWFIEPLKSRFIKKKDKNPDFLMSSNPFFFLAFFVVKSSEFDLETKLLCYLTPPFHQCSRLDEFYLPKYAHSHWMTEPTFLGSENPYKIWQNYLLRHPGRSRSEE